jgi:predicted Zn-dependent protease with MMP-like domain
MSDEIESRLYELHDESASLYEEGDVLGALEKAEEAHGLATSHREAISEEALIDTLYLLADTLVEAEAADEALPLYDEIRRLCPDDDSLPLRRGLALLHVARLDEARREIESAPVAGENAAEAFWHLAVLAEFRGEEETAERLFAKAQQIAPDLYPLPVRMGPEAVQRLLSGVIEDLPDEVRAAVANVVIQVEPLPDVALLRQSEPPISLFVLGLHQGTAWGEQSVFEQPCDLDRILIFQKNIERIASEPAGLHDQLRITLLHEIGHHLGWDEDDLAERGLD